MPPASPNLSMILSAVVKTENYKCVYYDTLCTFPLLPLPQVLMLPKQLFTSCARHGEKGLLYQGKDLLKSDLSTKSSSEVFFSGDINNKQNLFLCGSFPIKCFFSPFGKACLHWVLYSCFCQYLQINAFTRTSLIIRRCIYSSELL